jgi:hypothetical protein
LVTPIVSTLFDGFALLTVFSSSLWRRGKGGETLGALVVDAAALILLVVDDAVASAESCLRTSKASRKEAARSWISSPCNLPAPNGPPPLSILN